MQGNYVGRERDRPDMDGKDFDVGGRLRDIRQRAGLSQRELARRLSKPPSFVNKIELLERRLDVLEFIAIARAMEIAPQELLSRIIAALADGD